MSDSDRMMSIIIRFDAMRAPSQQACSELLAIVKSPVLFRMLDEHYDDDLLIIHRHARSTIQREQEREKHR